MPTIRQPEPNRQKRSWLMDGVAGRGERLLFIGAVVIIAYLVLPPLIYMVWTSLTPGGRYGVGGSFSFSAYAAVFTTRGFSTLISNSVLFTTGSTLVALVLGGTMAWLVERTDTLWKPWAYVATFTGFAVPAILRTIGWMLLLGPSGFANRQLADWLPEGFAFNVLNMSGMVFIEGLLWVPPTFLLLVAPFRAMDPSLEEAAAVSGAGPLAVIRRVTLRLLLPSLLSAGLLTSIRVFKALEVPLVVGIPGKVNMLTSYLYERIQRSGSPDYAVSSAYGVLMVLVLSILLALYYRVTREAGRFQTVTGKGYRPRVMHLGRWRWGGGAFLLAMFGLQVLPVLFLLLTSFLPNLGIRGPLWQHLTFQNYVTMFNYPGVMASLSNSLLIAIISATGAVLLVSVAAWIVVRSRVRLRWLIDVLLGFPLVFPGVVMSLAVMTFYLRVPVGVYGTIWILVLAYLATFSPYAFRYVHPALLQIHRELEESAYTSGARPWVMYWRILLPLLAPALTSAWVFIFLITVRELSVAAFLYTAQTPVVATQILDMWTNGSITQLSAFGSLITTASVAVVGAVYATTRQVGIH